VIAGIGVDIIEVARITRALGRRPERFLARLFTRGEIADCGTGQAEHSARRLAARFAAKEATLKALGIGLRAVKWTDVEVVKDPLGKPLLRVSGHLAEIAAEQGVAEFHVSLSHCKEYAVAQVVAVR
jgi:holo-[acyl-carrier protein] synthase